MSHCVAMVRNTRQPSTPSRLYPRRYTQADRPLPNIPCTHAVHLRPPAPRTRLEAAPASHEAYAIERASTAAGLTLLANGCSKAATPLFLPNGQRLVLADVDTNAHVLVCAEHRFEDCPKPRTIQVITGS